MLIALKSTLLICTSVPSNRHHTPPPATASRSAPIRPGGRRTRSASAVDGVEESEENRSSGAPAHRRNCLRARGEGGARSATGGKHERGEQKGDLKFQIVLCKGDGRVTWTLPATAVTSVTTHCTR